MTAGEPPELQLTIQRMLELEHAEKIVMALACKKLPALTDDELEEIIAIAGEDAPLFDPDSLELDGWRRDHNRHWIPPDIHAIDVAAGRGQGEQLRTRPAHGSESGTPGSSSSTAAQKLAELTPTGIPRRVRSYEERRAEGTVGERPRELDSPLGPAGRLDRPVGRTPAPIGRRSRPRFPWFVVTA